MQFLGCHGERYLTKNAIFPIRNWMIWKGSIPRCMTPTRNCFAIFTSISIRIRRTTGVRVWAIWVGPLISFPLLRALLLLNTSLPRLHKRSRRTCPNLTALGSAKAWRGNFLPTQPFSAIIIVLASRYVIARCWPTFSWYGWKGVWFRQRLITRSRKKSYISPFNSPSMFAWRFSPP